MKRRTLLRRMPVPILTQRAAGAMLLFRYRRLVPNRRRNNSKLNTMLWMEKRNELMANEPQQQHETDDRVVRFRPRSGAGRYLRFPTFQNKQPEPPVAGLTKYEHSGEDDDYRHRMIANAFAVAATLVLIFIGVWIANTLAEMRKNQDCVLSGRRGCTPVDVQPQQGRW